MSRPVSYYADEHIAGAIARALRARGVDIQTAVEAGLLGATDEEHLQHALEQERIIVTQDADFLRLHDAGAEHPGIVYAAQGTSIGEIVRQLLLIHDIMDADEMMGHVEFV